MKYIVGFILFSVVLSFDEQEEIGFLYGVLGRMDSKDIKHMILQDSSIIYTGDEVRINAGYKKESHFYVIYKGSQGELDLLYPYNNEIGDNLADLPDTIYTTILSWSAFSDPPGYETFYLINSISIQENLENLFKRYNKVKEKGRKKLAKQIQNEIDNLDPEKKQNLSSIGSRLNKPVVGGVTFRGEDEDELKDISLTDSCMGSSGIAFKKILLDHK